MNSYGVGDMKIEEIEVTTCLLSPGFCTACTKKYGNCTDMGTLYEWHKLIGVDNN